MSAAKTTAARNPRRRSAAIFLSAIAAASLTLGSGSFAAVLGADPNGTETPPTTPADPPKTGNGHSNTNSAPKDSPPANLSGDQQRTENVIAAVRQYVGIPYRVGS